jgi:uncharacterized protein
VGRKERRVAVRTLGQVRANGGRRIGKTALLTHWGSQRTEPYLYWIASQTSAANQLRHFSQALFQFLNPGTAVTAAFSYPSWDAAFAEVARLAANRRVVVVLDEFTYVMQADPKVPSLLQRAWDHQLKNSQVFLILMGSLAGIDRSNITKYLAVLREDDANLLFTPRTFFTSRTLKAKRPTEKEVDIGPSPT